MGAVFGILGGSQPGEMQALGARLSHRGAESAEGSPASGLALGVRGSGAAVRAQTGSPIAFDGAIDNRAELALALGRRGEDATPAGDGPLAAELWGAYGEEGLARIAGQFALALWDSAGRRLILARDRVGYAPLYIAIAGERLLFASEYKALLALDVVPARPNRAALQAIQSTKWVLPGVTCVEGIHPVAPGSWIEAKEGHLSTRRYWDIPVRAADLDDAGHAKRLRESFLDTLRRQAEPYDKIGISLSGGLDSAVVAAGVRAIAGDPRGPHLLRRLRGRRQGAGQRRAGRAGAGHDPPSRGARPRRPPRTCCRGWCGTWRSRSGGRTSPTSSSRPARRRSMWT